LQVCLYIGRVTSSTFRAKCSEKQFGIPDGSSERLTPPEKLTYGEVGSRLEVDMPNPIKCKEEGRPFSLSPDYPATLFDVTSDAFDIILGVERFRHPRVALGPITV
jgi:hypothetical protein